MLFRGKVNLLLLLVKLEVGRVDERGERTLLETTGASMSGAVTRVVLGSTLEQLLSSLELFDLLEELGVVDLGQLLIRGERRDARDEQCQEWQQERETHRGCLRQGREREGKKERGWKRVEGNG